jgi:hypothetical protein
MVRTGSDLHSSPELYLKAKLLDIVGLHLEPPENAL